MAIRRFRFEVTADEKGTAHVRVRLVDGILLAIKTSPGTPAPRRRFDVLLLDEVEHDVLQSVGLRRQPGTQRSIVRSPPMASQRRRLHPVVSDEPLRLVVLGLSAGASVLVVLFVGSESD